ncbi:MAG TPA: hypothetical protein PK415_03915, partial [Bacilli bacterium]|nr:hypothetical protein [Bacilli bacterium]
MKKRIIIILLLVIGIFFLTSCKKNSEEPVVKPDPFVPSNTKVIGDNMQEETVFAVLDGEGKIVSLKVVAVLDEVEENTFYTINAHTLNANANLSENNPLVKEGSLIKIPVKNAKDKYYYELELDKSKYELPYSFKFTYFLNDEVKTLSEIIGKEGTIKIKLEIIPNEEVAEEIRNQFVAQVQVPINVNKADVLDYDGAMTSVLAGSVRTLAYLGMPGSNSTYELVLQTKSFERINATISLQALKTNVFDLESIFKNIDLGEDAMSKEELQAMVMLMLGGIAQGMTELEFINLLNNSVKNALQGVLNSEMDFSALGELNTVIPNLAPPVAAVIDEELRGVILASYIDVTNAAGALNPELFGALEASLNQAGQDLAIVASYDPKYQKIVETKDVLTGMVAKVESLDLSLGEDVALVRNNLASLASDFVVYDNDLKDVFANFNNLLLTVQDLATKIGDLIEKLYIYQNILINNVTAFGEDPAVQAQVQTIIGTIANEQGTGLVTQLYQITEQIGSLVPTPEALAEMQALLVKDPETNMTPLDMPLYAILELTKELNTINQDTPISA